MHRQGSIITGLLLAGLLVFAPGCFSETAASAPAPRCITPEDAERLADNVLQLVNFERLSAELPPVVVDDNLAKVAADYACLMIEENFFGHHDPVTGYGPGDRAGAGKYAAFKVGENLAVGQETAADVMKVWMESPPHRNIILDPQWKEIGIAVRSGGEYGIYWVMEFGDPVDFPNFGD